MLSSMSYTPDHSEVFARNLRSRLQSLNIPAPSSPLFSSSPENLSDNDGIDILMATSRPGTTFPPSRFIYPHDLAAPLWCHSESNLARQPVRTSPPKTESKFVDVRNNDDDDSDLFFDFDFDSPASNAKSRIVDGDTNNDNDDFEVLRDDGEEEDSEEAPSCGTNGSSHILEEAATDSPDSPVHPENRNGSKMTSSTFGSISSGLFSDGETMKTDDVSPEDIQAADDMLEGISLQPEEWLNNPGASLHDLMNCGAKKFEDDDNPSFDGEESGKESSEESIDENGMTKIMIGDQEKLVAHSKLSALISLLGKENAPMNQRSRAIKSPSPTKKVTSANVLPLANDDKISPEERSPDKSSPDKSSPDTSSLDMSDATNEADGKMSPPKSASIEINVPKASSTGQFGRGGRGRRANQPGSSPVNFWAILGLKDPREKPKESSSPPIGRSLSTSTLSDIHKSQMDRDQREQIAPAQMVPSNERVGNDDVRDDQHKSKNRRCSSLKSGKTPPGTPSRGKLVRFADVFGLDLADVKTFFDEVPRVPRSAFRDLKDAELSDFESSDSGSERQFPVHPPSGGTPSYSFLSSEPAFSPLFNQPGRSSDFFKRLRDQKVCLESAATPNRNASLVHGVARVVNLDFHKRVFVRYTTDNWATTEPDIDAAYIAGSCDGFSDKFAFDIPCAQFRRPGTRVQLCVGYECSGNTYWDNNAGRNYTFLCIGGPQSYGGAEMLAQSPSTVSDPWHHYM